MTTSSRTAALLAALLAALTLAAVPAPDARAGAPHTVPVVRSSAAPAASLHVRPRAAIRGERVVVTGRLAGVRGVVRLERSTRAGWAKVAAGKADRRGSFRLTVRARWAGTTRLRVVSTGPAVRRTPVRSVRVVGQSVRTEAPRAGHAWEEATVRATTSPARPGRATVLQELRAGVWRTVATGRQDPRGLTDLRVTSPRSGSATYRAVALPSAGAPAAASPPSRTDYSPGRVVLSDDLRVVSDAEAAAIDVDVETGALVIDRTATPVALLDVTAGDVLAIPPTRAFRSGGLVRVLRRTDPGLTTVLDVEETDLPEVVEEVPDDAARFAGRVLSSAVEPGTGVTVESAPDDEQIHLRIDLELPPNMGPGPGQTITGDVRLTPVASLEYDVDGGAVDRYAAASGFVVDADVVVDTHSTKRPFTDIRLAAVRLVREARIGGLPVWFETRGVIDLSTGNTAQAKTRFRLTGPLGVGVSSTHPGLTPTVGVVRPELAFEVTEARGPGQTGTGVRDSLALEPYSRFGLYADSRQGGGTTLSSDFPAEFTCRTSRDGSTNTDSYGIRSPLEQLLTGRTGHRLQSFRELATRVSDGCPPPTAPQVVTTELPEIVVGEPFGYRLETTDGRRGSWAVVDGSLPPGLALTDDGRLQGTYAGAPATTTATFRFTGVVGGTREVAFDLRAVEARSGPRWRDVRSRGRTTCGVQVDGSGWCWGGNEYGQVGDGSTQDRTRPVRLPGEWTSIQPGRTTCAVRPDATGWCWGDNREGQVGIGSTADTVTVPTQVDGRWLTVDSGRSSTTCGIQTDRSGWCWGARTRDLDGRDPGTPGRLVGEWQSLSTSSDTFCGVQLDDTAWCRAAPAANQPELALRRLDHEWRTIDGSGCGIRSDGMGWCEDRDGSGPVPLDGELRQLSGGRAAGCGTRTDGSGWCWGWNTYGQVGDGVPSDTPVLPPYRLPGVWDAVEHGTTSCGVRPDRTLWCWGFNLYGEVGTGLHDETTPPQQVAGSWRSFPSSFFGSCTLRTDGTAWCWGSNYHGQVGDGTTTDRRQPVQVR